ncbi:hypothetical protein R5R35_003328 [Gryllus longicercus]|uniref:Chemosensory protein n=1 Tax=Gryllus longicercus TaxID=2509291 RepID=A0AAN9VTE3_9ORTH
MKFLLVLAAVAALAAAQSIEEIGNRDISSLLADRALVMKQISCVLDQGPCDELGRGLKAAIPEILHNNCGRCNPKQASNARLVVGFLQRNYPRVYTAVENKYRKGGRSG